MLKSKLNVNQLKRFKKQIETFWIYKVLEKKIITKDIPLKNILWIIKGPRLIADTWLIWLWLETCLAKPVDSQKKLCSKNWQKYRNERYLSSYKKNHSEISAESFKVLPLDFYSKAPWPWKIMILNESEPKMELIAQYVSLFSFGYVLSPRLPA